jgi:two-component system response regulator NreC
MHEHTRESQPCAGAPMGSTMSRQAGTGRLRLAPSPDTSQPRSRDRPIRVVLADDHPLMRRNLRLLLDNEPGIQVTAEVADLATATSTVYGDPPDVLVLDLGMPGGSNVDTIRWLREQVPDTEIVVLTMDDSPAFAEQALNAGALGYVLKDYADAELGPAVRSTSRGEEHLSPRVAEQLDALRRSVVGDALTARETEVLRLTSLGYTSAEIARRLHVSRRTVETHRARIHRKLGLTTRAQLVRYALRHSLLGA